MCLFVCVYHACKVRAGEVSIYIYFVNGLVGHFALSFPHNWPLTTCKFFFAAQYVLWVKQTNKRFVYRVDTLYSANNEFSIRIGTWCDPQWWLHKHINKHINAGNLNEVWYANRHRKGKQRTPADEWSTNVQRFYHLIASRLDHEVRFLAFI